MALCQRSGVTHWTEAVFVDTPSRFLGQFEERLGDAPTEVEQVLDLVESTYGVDPSSVLDVPCGVGRHSVAFADRGRPVHGVDLSPTYVDRARDAAAEAGVDERTTFVTGDMRQLSEDDPYDDPLESSYDLAVNLWTSLGYYGERADRRIVAGIYDRLAPGGVAVFELVNKEGTLSEFYPVGRFETPDGLTMIQEVSYEPTTSHLETERIVLDEEAETIVDQYTIDVRTYAPVELIAILEDTGFGEVTAYGSLEGEELTWQSDRLVVLGRR